MSSNEYRTKSAAAAASTANVRRPVSMSRRTFVAGASLLAAQAALFGISGCAPKQAGSVEGFAPGTYTASAQGRGGEVTVQAVFTEDAIQSIEVDAPDETRRISDMAISDMPNRIVEHQSLAVDTVTGATLTSMAILTATADCVEQAGRTSKSLQAPVPPAHEGEQQMLECDVVVVGAGASGMAAAVSCAQNGEQVVLIEKASNTGGNALVSGGHLEYVKAPDELREDMTPGYRDYLDATLTNEKVLALDASHVDQVHQEVADWEAAGGRKVFDSPTFHVLDLVAHRDGNTASWEVASGYVNNVVELDDWFNELGLEWGPLHGIVGSPWPRWGKPAEGEQGEGYFFMFDDVVDRRKLPIDIKTCTRATSLIEEGGRIVGVEAQADDGMSYTVNASKAVVLASGGFAGNPELLKQYNESWPWDEHTAIPTTNAYGHTGDGLQMCLDAGGYEKGLEAARLFPFADAKNYSVETIIGDSADCLLVNKNGERFVNESLDRAPICIAIMGQPEALAYIISCESNSKIRDGKSEGGISVEKLIKDGQLYRADTLDDLAGQIGCDAATLKQTVERYNGFAKNYSDTDLGRVAFTEKSPIEQGPFYASPRTWAAHSTPGGVVVNDRFQVMREDGSVIERLYGIGELTAGSYGIGTMGSGLKVGRIIAGATA